MTAIDRILNLKKDEKIEIFPTQRNFEDVLTICSNHLYGEFLTGSSDRCLIVVERIR